MPYSPKDDTHLRALQIQRLHAKHQHSPRSYPFTEQITNDDVALATLLEPHWKPVAHLNSDYPVEWVTKMMSLKTVLQNFRAKAQEPVHIQNRSDSRHTLPTPLRSCPKKATPAGTGHHMKESRESSKRTVGRNVDVELDRSLQRAREHLKRLEASRDEWREKALMARFLSYHTKENSQRITSFRSSLALPDKTAPSEEVH